MADNVSLNEEQTIAHEALLKHLQEIREKLMMVDPKSLTIEQSVDWNKGIDQVSLAISAVEGAILTSISQDYAEVLPGIERATNKLTGDLEALKKANDVIEAVGSALGTIGSIVSLLK